MYHHRVDYPGFDFSGKREARPELKALKGGAEPPERLARGS
jgi:hypothetical protein